MPTQITTLVTERQTQAYSDAFEVEPNKPVTVVIHGTPSEDCPVQMQLEDDSWEPMLSADLILNGALNAIQIVAAGVYRVDKVITAADVGVTIYRY